MGVVEYESKPGPNLGVELGGLHAAESLLVARYWMFLQVYHHDVRRIYDLHLLDYMSSKYGKFPVGSIPEYIRFAERKVLEDIMNDSNNSDSDFNEAASRIHQRKHFRAVEPVFYRRDFFESKVEPAVKEIVEGENQAASVKFDKPKPEVYKTKHFESLFVFNKQNHDRENPRSVLDESDLLWNMKPITPCRIYVAPDAVALRSKIDSLCFKLKIEENQITDSIRRKVEAK